MQPQPNVGPRRRVRREGPPTAGFTTRPRGIWRTSGAGRTLRRCSRATSSPTKVRSVGRSSRGEGSRLAVSN